jgi:hypothetical protein
MPRPGVATPANREIRDAATSQPRPKFARLSRDPERAVRQMAARIKFMIEFFSEDGESMRVQELKRGLHAYRYSEFDDAIQFLEKRRQIVVRRVQSQGRVFRAILRRDRRTRLPDPFVFHRKKRSKRKRPPTEWFLERRQLMDAGQHSGFAEIQPWRESAYWYEKEQQEIERAEAAGSK